MQERGTLTGNLVPTSKIFPGPTEELKFLVEIVALPVIAYLAVCFAETIQKSLLKCWISFVQRLNNADVAR